MADNQRRLILGNGEQYIKPVYKPPTGRTQEPPRSYEEARDRIKKGVQAALFRFDELLPEKKLPEEAVFCMRLHPDVTAKSYDPAEIFDEVPELRSIGSRMYRVPVSDVAPTKRMEKKAEAEQIEVEARLVFVQSSTDGFKRLLRHLDNPESSLTQGFRNEVRRIERFDTLAIEEQLAGFGENWKEGRVELVLHPSRTTQQRQLQFLFELFESANVDVNRSSIRPYPGGPTFISCRLNRSSLDLIAGVNPLRSAHPMRFDGLNRLRNAPTAGAPNRRPPQRDRQSKWAYSMAESAPAYPSCKAMPRKMSVCRSTLQRMQSALIMEQPSPGLSCMGR